MQEVNNKQLSAADCPSAGLIQKYISDQLSDKEKNELERHTLDCELCADAIAGYSSFPDQLDILKENRLIKKRVDVFFTDKKIKKENLAVWAAAASLIIIIGASILFFFSTQKKSMLAKMKEERTVAQSSESLAQNEKGQLNPDIADKVVPPVALLQNKDKYVSAPVNSEETATPLSLPISPAEDEAMNEGNKFRSSLSAPALKEEISQEALTANNNENFADRKSENSDDTEIREDMIQFAENNILHSNDAQKNEAIEPSKQQLAKRKQANIRYENIGTSTSKADSFPGSNETAQIKSLISFEHAKMEYKKGNFKHANEILNELMKNNPKDQQVVIFEILTKIQLGKSNEALVLASSPPAGMLIGENEQKWLIALASLDVNLPESKILLTNMAKGKNKFAKEASAILKSMEKK